MRNRFTMDMNDDLAGTLERVRSAIGAANKADVVREALTLLLTLVEVAEAQQSLFIGTGSDDQQRVLVPSLENAARAARARQQQATSDAPAAAAARGR